MLINDVDQILIDNAGYVLINDVDMPVDDC